MAHRLLLALLVLTAFALAACKGATNGKPPVDHPIYEHHPPAELADLDDGDDDDMGDEDDDEDSDEADGDDQ